MKIGIDQFCYHRYFGEIYSLYETDPLSRMSVFDFIDKARELGVEGVSLETAFNSEPINEIKECAKGLDIVWAWGHPRGLESGEKPSELASLITHIGNAKQVGAKIMRICAGGRATRNPNWAEHKRKLVPLLEQATEAAKQAEIILAVENHIDFLADEIVDLIQTINSPNLRICLDTANNLRLFEEPMGAIRKMAPFAATSHMKDIIAQRGDPRTMGFLPSCPLNKGLIDIEESLRILHGEGFTGLLALELDVLHPQFTLEEAMQESIETLKEIVAKVS